MQLHSVNGIQVLHFAQSDKAVEAAGVSDRGQRLIEIFEDVIDLFNPDRDSHQTVCDANRFAALFAQSGVSHRGGMRDQGLDASQRFSQRAKAEFLQHFIGILQRTGFKGDH